MVGEECLADGFSHRLSHGSFVMKLHLAFGGMDVHVDSGGVDFKKQAARWIAAFHQCRVIALQKSEIESAIFHGAAVHEQMLVFAIGPRHARFADEADRKSTRLNSSH